MSNELGAFMKRALWPATLCSAVAFSASLFGTIVDQPHVDYDWFPLAIAQAAMWAAFFWLLMWVACGFEPRIRSSQGVQSEESDLACYPRLFGLKRALASPGARLFLIVGFLLLVGYWILTEIALWAASSCPHGNIWPPQRVCYVLQLCWGILWSADCLTRPHKERLGAALSFLMVTAFFTIAGGTGVLME